MQLTEGEPKAQLELVINQITALEREREEIYRDSHVSPDEHPRLMAIERELTQLWDLRRRIEAAIRAGLSTVPVPPPPDAEQPAG